jgi:heat shock protein HslJ
MKSISVFLITATLFHTAKAQSTTMQPTQHNAQVSFSNTNWTLVKLGDFDLTRFMKPAEILFDTATHRVTGQSGCNRFFGSFTLEGQKLGMGKLGSTMMMCPPPSMELEKAFHAMLAETDNYRISGNRLQLCKGEMILAEFEAGVISAPLSK